MRWLLLLLPLFLFAKVLDLPVHYDPFAKAKRIVKKKNLHSSQFVLPRIHLDLIAIFNDKAYINGKFYTIGQNLYGYKLIDIKENYIVLRKGRHLKILPLVERKILKTGGR